MNSKSFVGKHLLVGFLAANVLPLHYFCLQYLYDFLDALMLQHSAPEEAYRKLDDIASRHTEALRKLTKRVQEARQNHDDEAVKRVVTEYEDTLERYCLIFNIVCNIQSVL